MEDMIRTNTYNIAHSINISRLLAIRVFVDILHPEPPILNPENDPPAQMPNYHFNCAIVDLMIPTKHAMNDHTTRNGQSDYIHTYFSTPQSYSTTGQVYPPHPAPALLGPNLPGGVPSYDIDFTITPHVPIYGGSEIQLRLIPLGFMIFETLRMLFVSKQFQDDGLPEKMMKYKQKLNVLLSTLMREDITQSVFELCNNPGIRTTDMLVRDILSGGHRTTKIEQPTAVKGSPVKMTDKQKKAREFSISLLKKEEESTEEELTIDPKSLDEVELLGYMDYLSYQDSNFSDFRLPLLEEEVQKQKTSKPLSNEFLKAFANATMSKNMKRKSYRSTTLKSTKPKKMSTRKKQYVT